VRDTGQLVDELISRARAAVAGARWLEALDLASQALAADPRQGEAAVLVGTARRRLGTVSAAGAELRQITVVAVDMARSTTIAARLGPERMREVMLELYELCVEAVARFEGRVTKYSGDGVLAQFGHPVAHEDDARRAVLAALAVLESVEARAPHWDARVGEAVHVRIGIDSGLAAVGPVDASPWSPDEIAGDPPNVATRVQSTAERMTVRVTDATHRLIQGWFETDPVGPVELRNYPRPVGLHRITRATDAETRLEASVRPRPSLVNRHHELAALRAAWNAVAASGEKRVVSITGEPGIGKSRLVEHMLATAVATGAAHVTLACSQLQKDSPLRPVARALARFFRVFPDEGGTDALWLDAIRRRLEQLANRRVATDQAVPIYGWLLGIRSAVDLQPELLRRQSFEALIDLFEAMAANSIVVLCVEDADAADPSTAELLQTLLARPPSPMLIILTSRAPLPWLENADEVLELGSLHNEEAAELVRSVAPALQEEVVAQVVQRADGVPFFAEELARAAAETDGHEVPETVELSSFLAARLDELGPEVRGLTRQIAVGGQEIRLDVLRQLTDVPGDELDELVAELTRRRVVVRSSEPTSDVVRFRHGVMRNVAYASLLEAKRMELHGQMARVLAGAPAGAAPPEDLARHYELAGERGRAAPHWLDAGRAAAASGANAEAVELFRRSLSALGHLAATPEGAAVELEAQLGLGTALSAVQGYTSPAARSSFERAVALAEGLEDTIAILPALWGTWAYWLVLGEHGVSAALADRCLRIAEEHPDEPRYRLVATAIAGYERLYLGRFASSLEELEWARRHGHVYPADVLPHDPTIVSLATQSVARWFLGEAERSREVAAEALALSGALDPAGRKTPLTQCFGGCLIAWQAELDGDPDAAIAYAEQAAAIAQANGFPTWVAAATLHRSIAKCSQGLLAEGLPVLAAMVDAWRSAGRDPTGRQLHPVLMTPYFAGRLAESQLASGDIEGAARELDRTLRDSAANGERFWDAELLRIRAKLVRATNGPGDTAGADLEAARGIAEAQGAKALLARIAADQQMTATTKTTR
jgi:class 3 adenylate cyclase/tetratricopeptide (TPR) repeat protein